MASDMRVVMIHGQNHKGSTYHLGKMLAEQLDATVTEFFLPRDFGEFCVGCTNCFGKSETLCPHYAKLKPITQAMDAADVLILTSPVYVYHTTGAMKAWLDHYGYRWMVHRPESAMFSKQAVCIATAAGAGMRSTLKDMADSMFFWGIPKVYKYGTAVRATAWEQIPEERQKKYQKHMAALAKRIRRRCGSVKPGMKTKGFFFIMRLMQRNGWCEPDVAYWKKMGWTEKARPWKMKK